MNYLQILGIFHNLDLQWSLATNDVANVQNVVTNSFFDVVSLDCLMERKINFLIILIQMFVFIEKNTELKAVYLRTIITVAIPFLYVFLFIFYFLMNWMRKKFVKSFQFMQKTISTLTISIFMAQPAIFNAIFLITNCQTLDPGTSFISTNIEESCLSNFYKEFYEILIIPAVIIFGIVLPLISFGFILIYRKSMYEENSSVTKYFSFLLNGYKKEKFYWLSIIIFFYLN